jgi:hypothetical protein
MGPGDVQGRVQLRTAPWGPLGGVPRLTSHPAEHHRAEPLPRADFDSAPRPR